MLKTRAPKSTASRIDVVFIRKSTAGQDDQGQRDNVQALLKDRAVYVPDKNWFSGTVSRRKVRASADFSRLMELVEADRVATVYVESQDRWGTADRPELFSLLGILRQHNTRLFDLRAAKDLTEKDLATELLAFVGSIKSEKELQDIAYRSLRTRVNNFKATGSWPTGSHPFGFGKACYSPDGKLLWVWQPTTRTRGQVFFPSAEGLTPGPENVPIPRKNKQEVIKLVPSSNADSVRAVKLVFDLYTRVGLARRQIAVRLNREGLLFNGGPFSPPDITNILKNPAYVGDTHFGKVQTGDIHTFDAKGLIVDVAGKRDSKHRAAADCIVQQDTHEGLIDRATWKLAQEKLASERERTSFAPRNPGYYLKQLLVCGHCGKGMTARTDINPDNGKRTVVYVCASYTAGRIAGHEATCGYHRITHAAAEEMLLAKIKELDLAFDATASDQARLNLDERLKRLGLDDEADFKKWEKWMNEGLDSLTDFFASLGIDYPDLPIFRKWTFDHYCGEDVGHLSLARAASAMLTDLKSAIAQAEAKAVKEATAKLAGLSEEHRKMTLAWAKASDLQQSVLKAEIDRIERDISDVKPRTMPLSERLRSLYEAEAERKAEREKLVAEWPTLESRERGEALRRLFKTVTLFWEKKFHAAQKRPGRERTTTRPGRFSYTLQKERIQWAFPTCEMTSTW